MGQVVSQLEAETLAQLGRQREWVWGSISSGRPVDRGDVGTVLAVLSALLDDGIRPDETWKLQSLGVVLGDALSSVLEVPWVIVDDELGRDAALLVQEGELIFPLTMISKRVEAGAAVDPRELFLSVCDSVLARRGEQPT